MPEENQCGFYGILQQAYSKERLEAYRRCEDLNNVKLFGRYLWNIALCEALYPILQNFEVVLRNSIHYAIAEQYQTLEWYEPDKGILNTKERVRIDEAKQKLVERQKQIEPGRVIAELNFGFWTALFFSRYEQVLWPKLLKKVFRFLPPEKRIRKKLYNRLDRIRNLRNRVFHHEPLWYWQDLEEQHKDILDLIFAINPVVSETLRLTDRFPEVFRKGENYYQQVVQSYYESSIKKMCPTGPAACRFQDAR